MQNKLNQAQFASLSHIKVTEKLIDMSDTVQASAKRGRVREIHRNIWQLNKHNCDVICPKFFKKTKIHLQEMAKNISLPSLFDPLTLALSILIIYVYIYIYIYIYICVFFL